MRTIGVITNEGFSCKITEDDEDRVFYTADADIDADGANGQNGAPAAYMIDDTGTEYLANGGMKIVNGKVICAKAWARDIVILDTDNEPKVFPGGIIASMTWYRSPEKRDLTLCQVVPECRCQRGMLCSDCWIYAGWFCRLYDPEQDAERKKHHLIPRPRISCP